MSLFRSSHPIRRDDADYVGAVKATMIGIIISQRREKKAEGGWLKRFFGGSGSLGGKGAVGRVEKLATCVAPTASSSGGWVLFARSVSVGSAIRRWCGNSRSHGVFLSERRKSRAFWLSLCGRGEGDDERHHH